MSTIEKAIERLQGAGKVSDGAAQEASPDKAPDGETFAASSTKGEAQAPPGRRSVKWDFSLMDAAGLLVGEDSKTVIAEEYRQIKRPLLVNAFATGAAAIENGNLIMITSALPGEGKTFSTINLAMSIALERDKTVLLVDADVARPAVSQYLSEKSVIGLVDYLNNDQISLVDVLVRTDIPNLRVLPAGRRHPHSTELLASARMEQLTRELSTRYPDRIILFDLPPLLATTEAAVLARLMGQIVMVVEAGRTQKEIIQEALALLDEESMISLILNKSRQPFGRAYYNYYHYHADKK